MLIDKTIPDERTDRSVIAREEASDSDCSKNNDPVNIAAESPGPSTSTSEDSLVEDNVVREPVSANRPKFDANAFLTGSPKWYSEAWRKAPGASDNNFEMLLSPLLEREDKQCVAWKDEVQNLLILAGLFSAVVTAFIIESYKTLHPDPNDQIISLLSRIADQMSVSNGSSFSHPLSQALAPNIFAPSPPNIRINIFWFISLVLSLTVALIGIVTLQWLREYQRYDTGIQSMDKFGIFNARSDGLQRWYVPQIFAGLPLLLQAALVLFFVGLVEFLFSICIEVAVPVSVTVAIPILFLIATTFLPTLQLYALHLPNFLRTNDCTPAPCPYKSPQALIFQRAAVASRALFKLSTWACGALWIPCVIVIRLFVRHGKPFYKKSAPFSRTEHQYQYSCDRLRNTARNWMVMDMQWLSVRTSYAMSIETPHTTIHLPSESVSNGKFVDFISLYDCVHGMKNMVALLHAASNKEVDTIFYGLLDVYTRLEEWSRAFNAYSNNPELGKALQGQVTAFLRVIGPFGQQQVDKFVEQSRGDLYFICRVLLAVFFDEALGSELDFSHQFIDSRLHRHLIVAQEYLSTNAKEVFHCSNLSRITPSLSVSTRRSFLLHRTVLERLNMPWMTYISRQWTDILKDLIVDTHEMVPDQSFARKCNGSSAARCSSNMHTESIVELTEYILLFQVPSEIQQTSRLLHNLIESKSHPIKDRPFILIIACAYINAVANVNQDDLDEFRSLLYKICDLCGSLDPTLEARPGGTGRHWPKMEDAFDYIRNNCIPGAMRAVHQSPDLRRSPGAYEIVRRQFISWRKATRTQEHVC